jgi:hypothetical protein
MKTAKKHLKKLKMKKKLGGNPTCKYNKNNTFTITIHETALDTNLNNLKKLCTTKRKLSLLMRKLPSAEDVFSTKGLQDGRRNSSSTKSK